MAVWDGVIPADDLERMKRFAEGKRRNRVPGERPALLIIDMIRRFVTNEFSSGDEEVANGIVEHLKPLLEQARASGIPVIYTTTQLRKTVAQAGQWGPSTEANGAANPRGSEIHPELEPVEGEEVLWKIPPSGFFNTDMVSLLNYYQIDTIIVTGMTTSGCVRATVVDGFSYNYTVLVPEECCGDRSQISHKVNLFDMHSKYAEVLTTEETLAYLRSVAPNPRKSAAQPVSAHAR